MDNQEKPKLNIVFVGHVDHGKSTLIGRLLFDTKSLPDQKISEVKTICEQQGRPFEFAFLMDHMQEERDQNITIDTAQIFFHTKQRNYVIIDAPGHREFTKNMITGATQAEAAILLVDAGEGVQEQTQRHAKFLSLLGLSQVIVVINKMDTADYQEARFDEVKKSIITFLQKININPSFVIPISAMQGDNIAKKSDKMSWYNGKTVLYALDTFRASGDHTETPLRFPVQDLYKFDQKRLIAGQIAAGQMKVGDPIVFLPKKSQTIIKSIEKFNETPQAAQAGESIAITSNDPIFVDRGDIGCQPDDQPQSTKQIKGNLFWMNKQPLKIHDNLTIHCATQESGVTVERISHRINSSSLDVIEEEAHELSETEVATVSLKMDSEIIVEDFNQVPELGRFTLSKNGEVLAGGIIILE
ncbi:MAG: GTP-binding protein [Patescibacteria group bacterium]